MRIIALTIMIVLLLSSGASALNYIENVKVEDKAFKEMFQSEIPAVKYDAQIPKEWGEIKSIFSLDCWIIIAFESENEVRMVMLKVDRELLIPAKVFILTKK